MIKKKNSLLVFIQTYCEDSEVLNLQFPNAAKNLKNGKKQLFSFPFSLSCLMELFGLLKSYSVLSFNH